MYKNKIGVIYQLKEALENGIKNLIELDINCVQLQCFSPELLTQENAKKVKKIMLDSGIEISSFWAGWTGPNVWNLTEGPETLGLVPEKYREHRYQELLKGVDFASWLGVKSVATHVGFIPETPDNKLYQGTLAVLKNLVDYCTSKNVCFNFETGQETPDTLMNIIKDINNPDYTGISFDPANLIIYGKGNPTEAIDTFGKYIKEVHIKDADYSSVPNEMGCEQVVGEGQVNFSVFLPKLLNQGYTGNLYIEREIQGEQKNIDIKNTVTYIRKFL